MLYDWGRAGACAPGGEFFDETLRDGVQAPGVATPALEQRFRLIDHMVRSGVRCADLGFPGSGPEAARVCAASARYVAEQRHPLVPACAGRTHPADVRAIAEVAQQAGIGVEAYVFIGVSPIRQYVEGWSAVSVARDIRVAADVCRKEGLTFVLVLEDSSRCTPEVLAAVYDVALDLGVGRIALCDTVGAATPAGAEGLVRWSAGYFADRRHPVAFEWHGHNDRGLALANSLAALAAGCARVHGTVLGVGERAGNASIDQLIVNSVLDHRGDYDLKALRDYCEVAAEMLGVVVPPNYPAIGSDVFKTSAGVHAAAILKAHRMGDVSIKDTVYAAVPATLLGRRQEVLIDGSSGASNVRYWLSVNGVTGDAGAIEAVLRAAKQAGRPLTDDEIRRALVPAR